MSDQDHQRRFPGLRLAWDSLAGQQGLTAVLNAANEVAVELFLNQQIQFNQIHVINAQTMSSMTPALPTSLGDLLEIDREARSVAHRNAKQLQQAVRH
jgi:1-deoxy-D-xylulose-5-phosphate reductoisomerase